MSTEVVADSFQLLESRAAREGHAGGGYSSGNGGFAGNATPSFGGSEPSNAAPNLVVKKIHLERIQWISQTTIFHSKNGFNELKL